jgi:hypothetical protein
LTEGFDQSLFAMMLGRIDRLDDEDFTEYNVRPEQVAALRRRVKSWRTGLAKD